MVPFVMGIYSCKKLFRALEIVPQQFANQQSSLFVVVVVDVVWGSIVKKLRELAQKAVRAEWSLSGGLSMVIAHGLFSSRHIYLVWFRL